MTKPTTITTVRSEAIKVDLFMENLGTIIPPSAANRAVAGRIENKEK